MFSVISFIEAHSKSVRFCFIHIFKPHKVRYNKAIICFYWASYSMSSTLLTPEQSLLLVIDIQEKFRPALFNAEQVIANTERIIKGCEALGVPIIFTEQYPQGLGHTVPELTAACSSDAPVYEKTAFGCFNDEAIAQAIQHSGRRQIMVCGIESHICVNQTVCRLLAANFQVHLIEDAIGSRQEAMYQIGLKKMTQLGAFPSCVEMALFELLASAQHPQFKTIQALVR
jgi:nicotinamidase-related amidase